MKKCFYLSNKDCLMEHVSWLWNMKKIISPHSGKTYPMATVNTTKISGMSLGPQGDKWIFGGLTEKPTAGFPILKHSQDWAANTLLLCKHSSGSWACFSVGRHYPKNKIRRVKRRFPIGLLLRITEELVSWRGVDFFLTSKHSPQPMENPRKDFRSQGTNWKRKRP